ncbi:uncharacterized protein PHACADRAFT_192458 [Phanerochaete carnosa HHB-10118-sp]|uniref:Uncharacterized protein n=1 Tax=Phanerochaete carnosa (strain HHB-10118-sp) TaxID=650164 RepID=K5XAU3_PHACS|nr:uncharacterized protein PHACADRAFT_192458 [Phanerochaete carnosa HHB-10118-sp]EKM60057.1 hypothetical protein PHACADRAFT_192458 [Phanerochaete carnosa HHB-10118-sp]
MSLQKALHHEASARHTRRVHELDGCVASDLFEPVPSHVPNVSNASHDGWVKWREDMIAQDERDFPKGNLGGGYLEDNDDSIPALFMRGEGTREPDDELFSAL